MLVLAFIDYHFHLYIRPLNFNVLHCYTGGHRMVWGLPITTTHRKGVPREKSPGFRCEVMTLLSSLPSSLHFPFIPHYFSSAFPSLQLPMTSWLISVLAEGARLSSNQSLINRYGYYIEWIKLYHGGTLQFGLVIKKFPTNIIWKEWSWPRQVIQNHKIAGNNRSRRIANFKDCDWKMDSFR